MADLRHRPMPWSTMPPDLIRYVIEYGHARRHRPFVRLEWSADAPRIKTVGARKVDSCANIQQSPGVTYVPGLICHPCSRPDAKVRRRGQRMIKSVYV